MLVHTDFYRIVAKTRTLVALYLELNSIMQVCLEHYLRIFTLANVFPSMNSY